MKVHRIRTCGRCGAPASYDRGCGCAEQYVAEIAAALAGLASVPATAPLLRRLAGHFLAAHAKMLEAAVAVERTVEEESS